MNADEKQVREQAREFCLRESSDCPHVQAAFASDDIMPVKPSEIIQFMADFALPHSAAQQQEIERLRGEIKERAQDACENLEDALDRAERAESALAAAHEALREFLNFATDCGQLLDGWHADGTAWSEWDESVRERLTKLHRMVEELISGECPIQSADRLRAIADDAKQWLEKRGHDLREYPRLQWKDVAWWIAHYVEARAVLAAHPTRNEKDEL